MVVAHNPGMSALVSGLSGQYHEMPTAAIAVLKTDSRDWTQLGASTKIDLEAFMRPKALPGERADHS